MPLLRCPVCRKQFDSSQPGSSPSDRGQSAALPFCSERCRAIDLGRWLGEAYSVPVERRDEDPDEAYGEEEFP